MMSRLQVMISKNLLKTWEIRVVYLDRETSRIRNSSNLLIQYICSRYA